MDKTITSADFLDVIDTQNAIISTVLICHPCKREFVENALKEKEIHPLYILEEKCVENDQIIVVKDLEFKKAIINALRQRQLN